MEENPALFNSQMNRVSLISPSTPVSLYFVPGDNHRETHSCYSECKYDRSVFHSQWKLSTYS